MVYTTKTEKAFRSEKGTLSQKITSELALIQAELATTEGEKIVLALPLSFETDEQMQNFIYFPFKVTIDKIRSQVTKALAAADDGTITCGNSTGASTGGVVTVAASSALEDDDTATPTTNNVVLANGYYYLTTAKSTAGGKVLVTIEATRTA